MVKKIIAIAVSSCFFLPFSVTATEPPFKESSCPTNTCGLYRIGILAFKDSQFYLSDGRGEFISLRGKISDIQQLSTGQYFFRYSVDCIGNYVSPGYAGSRIMFSSFDGSFFRFMYIKNLDTGTICIVNGLKALIWVDSFRGNKGIFWGLFKGAPDGCTAVGALIDEKSGKKGVYKGNLKNSEVEFGYQIAKNKQGVPIDTNSEINPDTRTETFPSSLQKLPINYRDSDYEKYYFRASWVSPACYWQVREVRRNSFGGILDFLWNIFK